MTPSSDWQVKCVLLIKKPNDDLSSQTLLRLARFLYERHIDVLVDPAAMFELSGTVGIRSYDPAAASSGASGLATMVDVVVSIGGDGTLLHVSQLFPERCPPILPINTGTLGFLTPFSANDAERAMEALVDGRFYITSRLRMTARVVRRTGRVLDEVFHVLNEVVVDRGYSSYLTNLETWVDGQHVTTIQADGVILATSTGSTAYSLSANGPVLHPSVQGMLLTPICAHSLSCRPIVLPGSAQVVFRVSPSSRGTSWAAFDSRCRLELAREDAVVVQASQWPLPTVSRTDPSCDFFMSLKNLFYWNERPIQKALLPSVALAEPAPLELPTVTPNSPPQTEKAVT